MKKTDPILRTKLRLPFTRPGLVSRPRLQERIAQGLCGPLTLITAPAGFGKTTLVASCIAGCGIPAAWLSLDTNDNQVGRFLTYLIAALQTVDTQIGAEAAQLMAGIQQASPEVALTSLINDLDAAGREIVLVLDDYQLISSPAVHEQAAFFLEHLPATFHLVIATRSDPPLPIARLRARGQTVELRAADLRFTEAEAAQFLNDVMGLQLDTAAVAKLEARTEGWAAGLQMAALSMRDRKDVLAFIEGFSGSNRYILDYLLEEVLASQPPDVQHFLLVTSILERLTAPLCDALLAEDEGTLAHHGGDSGPPSEPQPLRPSALVLKHLERENLFLIPLDGDGTWFRYHHLFSDLLRVRLQEIRPDRVHSLHVRASLWLEQNGSIVEAIQHLFAASEVERAASLIERFALAHWVESDLSVVRMADNLPRAVLMAHPKIGIYQAWLLVIQGQIETVLPLLFDLKRQLADADLKAEHHWLRLVVGLALAFLTPPNSVPEFDPLPDPQALEAIPADEPVLRDAADILYGMALGRRGEVDRAAEFARGCLQKEQPSSGSLTISTLVPFLATIYYFQGRLHAAAALCREFLDPIKEKGVRVATAGNMDVLLGEILYEWNCLEEAERHIRGGLHANEPWRNIMTDAFGMAVLAKVLQAQGDYAEAMQVVETFESRMQGKSRPVEFEEAFRTLRVGVQLASGDLRSAVHWADQVQLGEDYHLHKDEYRITLGRIRLAQGRYAEVKDLVAGVSVQGMAGNRIARQIEVTLLLAAAYAEEQCLPEAFDRIDSCLALAEPEGYVRIFLEVGEPVRDLLAAYLRSGEARHQHFARRVLDAFSPDHPGCISGSQPAGLIEPLSARELEVLQLMALGKTNQDIARQLVVATGTIKAHAASIYRKLEVANRTEAVARARQLNLFA